MSDTQLAALISKLQNIPQLQADEVPLVGTFYSLAHPEWPCLPENFGGYPVWPVSGTDNAYLVNDIGLVSAVSASRSMATGAMTASASSAPILDLGDIVSAAGTNSNAFGELPDIPNSAKFIAQEFSVIDTNVVAASDTNLYNACLAFGDDTGTNPVLRISEYQPGCLVMKASHFDYSSDSRNFCVVVCDKLDTPLYKSIDISNPSNNIQNGGWLVQGSIPAYQVSDPLYLVVSNISTAYNAFFRVIPYSGPTVLLTGPNAYDVVSNTVALQATITDLSGVTNQYFNLTVDGGPARYSVTNNNTILLETPYNQNGSCTIYLNTLNNAQIADPTNAPGDLQLNFSGTASLPVDFENDTYMAFSGNNSSPVVGTTYSLFVVNKAQNIEAIISDPSNGQALAHYSGYTPSAATIEIPWNFTQADGTTPYTNDTYVVKFIAYDPATLTVTNSIEWGLVRTATRNITTYEEEDPAAVGGGAINSAADSVVNALEGGIFEQLYSRHSFSLTQYEEGQVGSDRETVFSDLFPWVLTKGREGIWLDFVTTALKYTNYYSDFTYYMGHCNGTSLGGHPPGGSFVNAVLTTAAVKLCVWKGAANWRMRKVALWGCYSAGDSESTAEGTIASFPQAFGIRRGMDQVTGFTTKNAGLFFIGGLPMGGYSGVSSGTSVEVATQFDMLWVCGPNPYPGGCDPTYSFSWAVRKIRDLNPELDEKKSMPILEGFPYLPFAGIYDSNLVTNDISQVKNN